MKRFNTRIFKKTIHALQSLYTNKILWKPTFSTIWHCGGKKQHEICRSNKSTTHLYQLQSINNTCWFSSDYLSSALELSLLQWYNFKISSVICTSLIFSFSTSRRIRKYKIYLSIPNPHSAMFIVNKSFLTSTNHQTFVLRF